MVSQNHGISEWLTWEGASGGHLVKCICSSKATYSKLSRTVSSQFLNVAGNTLSTVAQVPFVFVTRVLCWLMFNLVYSRTLWSFSAKMFCQFVLVHDMFLPRCRTLHSSLLNLLRNLSSHFFQFVVVSPGRQHDPTESASFSLHPQHTHQGDSAPSFR